MCSCNRLPNLEVFLCFGALVLKDFDVDAMSKPRHSSTTASTGFSCISALKHMIPYYYWVVNFTTSRFSTCSGLANDKLWTIDADAVGWHSCLIVISRFWKQAMMPLFLAEHLVWNQTDTQASCQGNTLKRKTTVSPLFSLTYQCGITNNALNWNVISCWSSL